MDDILRDWKAGAALVSAVALVGYTIHRTRSTAGAQTTKLRGPPRDHLIMGQTRAMLGAPGTREVLEEWANDYGGIFTRPGPFGSSDLCVTDPTAIAHILSHSQDIWHISTPSKLFMEKHVGRGLLSADGEDHKRQRRAISPGFSSVKIREYSSTFRDCAAKLVAQWDAEFAGSNTCVFDMNKCFTAYALDTIGLAGFGHDFGALDGRSSAVATAFEDFARHPIGIRNVVMVALQSVFVRLGNLPTEHWRAVEDMRTACSVLARDLLERDREIEKDAKSIMGFMLRAESVGLGVMLTEEELTTQIRTIILAGYETTSSTLASTLIELCRNPDVQDRLRTELTAAFPDGEPTYDVLVGCPFLDAVLHEALRLHTPLPTGWRTAQRDDVIPLFAPVVLPGGTRTNRIFVRKGTLVTIEIDIVNRMHALWGEDAWEFRPDRWLKPLPEGAQAIAGYHHLSSFGDGSKVCLGRSFAITNVKTLLAVLVRNFSFELPNGIESKIATKFTLANRPKVEGEEGFALWMVAKRVE